MCHMIADINAELLEMADRIGVARRWIQSAGLPTEHFEISQTKRALAVEAGALAVTGRELVAVIRRKRWPEGCRCHGPVVRPCPVHPGADGT